PAVRRIRPSQRKRVGRDIEWNGLQGQGDPAARPHRCRGGEARGLAPRSVRAGRREWLFLWPRRLRRQGARRDLHGYAGSFEASRNQASAAAKTGPDLWRGNRGGVQWRRVAGERAQGLDRWSILPE